MSARAVGAHLLRQMEQEELVEKCTMEAFCSQFKSLIDFELRTMRREKWDHQRRMNSRYLVCERLWKSHIERTRKDIERKYDERVVLWGDWWAARYAEVNAYAREVVQLLEPQTPCQASPQTA